MSKTLLKKELENFTKEQLIEVIVDLYSKRKEVKQYFEFYLNPDSKKLYEKYMALIVKEFARVKWGYSKARITRVTGAINEFLTFSPDNEYVHDIYIESIRQIMRADRYTRIAAALRTGADRLLVTYLDYCDRNLMLDRGIENVRTRILAYDTARPSFRDSLSNLLAAYIQDHAL